MTDREKVLPKAKSPEDVTGERHSSAQLRWAKEQLPVSIGERRAGGDRAQGSGFGVPV